MREIKGLKVMGNVLLFFAALTALTQLVLYFTLDGGQPAVLIVLPLIFFVSGYISLLSGNALDELRKKIDEKVDN